MIVHIFNFTCKFVCMYCYIVSTNVMINTGRNFSAFSLYIVIPSIENSIDNEIRNQEENVTFFCQSVGEPVPYISWYFNGVRIYNYWWIRKYMIVSRSLNVTTTENTLTVYNVISSDAGTYTCSSSNIIGSATSSGILTVTSKF